MTDFPQANLANPTVVRILVAAGDSFARGGYAATSTKEIARRAGVSKSLLHYHFQSKDHLLFELQTMLFRNVAARVQRMTLEGTPSLDQAEAALDEVWRMIVANKAYVPLALDLWKLAATQPHLAEQQERLAAECLELLIGGIHQTLGPLVDRLALPPERLAQLLLSALPGFAVRLQMDEEAATRSFEDFKALITGLVTREDVDA